MRIWPLGIGIIPVRARWHASTVRCRGLDVNILTVMALSNKLRLPCFDGARHRLTQGLVAGIGSLFFFSALASLEFALLVRHAGDFILHAPAETVHSSHWGLGLGIIIVVGGSRTLVLSTMVMALSIIVAALRLEVGFAGHFV